MLLDSGGGAWLSRGIGRVHIVGQVIVSRVDDRQRALGVGRVDVHVDTVRVIERWEYVRKILGLHHSSDTLALKFSPYELSLEFGWEALKKDQIVHVMWISLIADSTA
jgi:hypothetical protein